MTADPAPETAAELSIVEASKRYLELIAPSRRRGLLLVAAVAISSLFEGLALVALIPLLSTDPVIDIGSLDLRGDSARWTAIGALVVLGLASAATKLRSETWALRFLGDTEERLRREMTEHLLEMRWADFVAMRIGDINTAALVAAAQISIGAHFFLRAIGAVAATVVLGVIGFLAAPVLSLVTVLFAGLVAVGFALASRRAQRHAAALTRHADDLGHTVQEVFVNLKYFQSTGNLAATTAQTDDVFTTYNQVWYRSQRIGPIMRSAYEAGAVIAIAAVLAVAVATDGTIGPRVVTFLATFARIVPRITLAQEWSQTARMQAPWYVRWTDRIDRAHAARRRTATLPNPVLPNPAQPNAAPAFTDRVELRDVSLTYPGADHPALVEASWAVARGEMVALVGTSGSGKTTSLDLVTGLLEPTSGSVLVDGVSLRELDRDRWQRGIGLVLQQNPVLHASVAANVTWTEAEIDLDRVRDCLAGADLVEVVDALPDGVHTVIGHGGARLSGGQLQRLALARAWYRRPQLLLLDEPTSALDAATERTVLELLATRRGDMAVVVATHRMDVARHADRVVMMDAGRVTAVGPWNEVS